MKYQNWQTLPLSKPLTRKSPTYYSDGIEYKLGYPLKQIHWKGIISLTIIYAISLVVSLSMSPRKYPSPRLQFGYPWVGFL
jgi:hypothetical protein